MIKNAIIESGNDYLFSVPYTPKTNAIEQYFNQIKTYLKRHRNVEDFNKLKINVNKAIYRVKPENYKNYFYNAYNLKGDIKLQRKPSTRRRKQKQYKYTYHPLLLYSLKNTSSLLLLYPVNLSSP